MEEAHNKESNKQPRESNRSLAENRQALLDDLVKGCQTESDLFGPDGVFTKLKGEVMNRLLQGELEAHLGYEKHGRRPGDNARNGSYSKRVETESGSVSVEMPRDREGTFNPQLIGKHQRRLEGFDEKVLALYARGMSTRDISSHLRELYSTEVSHELISHVTEQVMPMFRQWQSRPVEAVYPVLYIDALFVSVRDGQQIKKRPFYVALGITMDGTRDVLGLWSAASESSKFWLEALSELKQRGMQDVLFICSDGLTGLGHAIGVAFPQAVHQTCIVHMLRASMRFVSWADRRELCRALRAVYTAPNAQAAEQALNEVAEVWQSKYPAAIRVFRERWNEFVPFLDYPPEIRKILYTTNVIESLNSQLRRAIKLRAPFPNEDAVYKVFFLALHHARSRWNPVLGWMQILAQFDMFCPGRLPI